MKLYFIPYAGGSTATFKNWISEMRPEIDLRIIEMPGHGRRIMEDFITDFRAAVEMIYGEIKADVAIELQREIPFQYAIGGHCLGALLAYEVTQEISKRNEIFKPKSLIISGLGSPGTLENQEKFSTLSTESLKNRLIDEGGLSAESLEPEIMELLLPCVKADAKIFDSYQMIAHSKLVLPILVMYGENDHKSTESDVYDWKNYTEHKIAIRKFDGDHYFLLHQSELYRKEILDFLTEENRDDA